MNIEPTTKERTANIRVPATPIDELPLMHANARRWAMHLNLPRSSTASVVRYLLLDGIDLLEVIPTKRPRKTKKAD